MKKLFKIFSAFVALAMAIVLINPVKAAGNNTITINNTQTGHTYEAYQVFEGDYYAGKLSNIKWGSGVNSTNLLAALKADGSALKADFASSTTAEDVANVVKGYTTADKLDQFAEIVGANLSATKTDSVEGTGVYTISGLADGYYLVKDKDGSVSGNDAYTKYIIQVVGNVEVDAKASTPPFDKKIVEGDTRVVANNAALGEAVNYELTSQVPNMDGYNKYYYVINDTLSKGLTFNNDVKITIGEKELVKGTDFTVTENPTGTIKIVLNNFIQYKAKAGADIVVTYSATVNKDAEIGDVANTNTAHLVYSNNPNVTYIGENEPGPNEPTGKTPDKVVKTYVTEITVLKVDENSKALQGAEFTISGVSTKHVLITGTRYVEDNEKGTYWKLYDGSYTTTDPNTQGVDQSKYVDPSTKYSLETYDHEEEVSQDVTFTAFVNSEGKLVFTGLAAGEYTITEITAPNGYNKLKNPITVTITWNDPTTSAESTPIWSWTANVEGTQVTGTNVVEFTVVNNSGATLPSTGGMGTTLFYIVGGLLVVGAAVLLITKKRMGNEK